MKAAGGPRCGEDAGESMPGSRPRLALGLVVLGALLVGRDAAAGAGDSQASLQGGQVAPSEPAVVLDLNSATAAQLASLPGLGPKRAEAIVAARARHPFSRVTQLLQIRGIGPRVLQRLKAHLTVAGPVASPVASPATGAPKFGVEATEAVHAGR